MVHSTEFTVKDTNGNVLCHPAGATRKGYNSARKSAAKDAFWTMCANAGMYDPTTDVAVCAETLATAKARRGDSNRHGAMDMGHVIADSLNGAFCPCNMVPLTRDANLYAEDMPPVVARDPRTAWLATWKTLNPRKAHRAA